MSPQRRIVVVKVCSWHPQHGRRFWPSRVPFVFGLRLTVGQSRLCVSHGICGRCARAVKVGLAARTVVKVMADAASEAVRAGARS